MTIGEKIRVIAGDDQDPGAATFCINDEGHTLGNALRFMLMKK